MNMPAIPAGADDPSTGSRTWMHFYGASGDSLWLLIKGALLTIPTLGFYRFWLITKLRRFLWQNTRIGEDSFEYLGTAKELLLGFLVAVAILVPVYLGYFLLTLVAEEAQAFAGLPLFVFFMLLVQFAVFRARRYRLTRTAFRGVRFTMTGSGVRYAAMWAGWSLLTVVTLGLALPWQVASLERYKVNNTRWGDLEAQFAGTGWSLFKQGIGLWALSVLSLGGSFSAGVVYTLRHGMSDEFSVQYVLVLAAYLVGGMCFVLYKGLEWRWWLRGLRLGALTCASNLPVSIVLSRILRFIGLSILLVVGLGAAFFFIAMAVGLGMGGLGLQQDDPFALGNLAVVAGAVFAYLGYVLTLGVLYRQVMLCALWRIVVNSIQIENIEVLDTVAGSGTASSYVAEGFAEALDVGAF